MPPHCPQEAAKRNLESVRAGEQAKKEAEAAVAAPAGQSEKDQLQDDDLEVGSRRERACVSE